MEIRQCGSQLPKLLSQKFTESILTSVSDGRPAPTGRLFHVDLPGPADRHDLKLPVDDLIDGDICQAGVALGV